MELESYTSFAEVYDEFMDNVPYEEWCSYLHSLLAGYGIAKGLILDLGCGTGTLTEMLCGCGYDMIGVDSSCEMLQIAARKNAKGKKDILYLQQDMREFELYGTVKAVVSICDSINYITEPQELRKVFRLVNNYLDPGGFFIFDLNTVYKYKEILKDGVFAENRPECSFIWENYYEEEEKLNEYFLTLYIREKGELYRRYEEVHYQRAYEMEEIIELLQAEGLEFVEAFDAFTRNPPREDSERIYIVAKEIQKGVRNE